MPTAKSTRRTVKRRRTGSEYHIVTLLTNSAVKTAGSGESNAMSKRLVAIVLEDISTAINPISFDKPPPESTYEVFQQAFGVGQPTAPSSLPSEPAPEEILTQETVDLLKLYQKGIGIWMDIFDRSHTYQNEVVRHSLSSPLLMHAICALSAKQMSLTQAKFLWEPIASRFYGESLRLLIKELGNPETDRELLLAATILLGSYELLEQPGIDYQRHLYGANTLIETRDIAHQGTPLNCTSYWIYARQDVALALVNERSTLIAPSKWPAYPPYGSVPVEDYFGKRILWLLARVIEVRFSASCSKNQCSTADVRAFERLVSEIDSSWAALPSNVRGVYLNHAPVKDEGLSNVWFCIPSAAAACLYYHMAKILINECLLEKQKAVSRPSSDATELLGAIRHHAYAISSICLSSDLVDGALVVAVNPIFYAAKYIPLPALRTRLLGTLDHIETHLGFYTRDRQTQLHRESGS
ncbi:hypothetical protein BJY04DRAFT_213957 [Aspergillus karnatakaensis]|uniref:uncharacterized protein n=1 Tax=Aspergillus karnatakaensis TaxID=1810916 RepID=UPI003CCDE362